MVRLNWRVMYVCMHVCLSVCLSVCMYVCMYVCIHHHPAKFGGHRCCDGKNVFSSSHDLARPRDKRVM